MPRTLPALALVLGLLGCGASDSAENYGGRLEPEGATPPPPPAPQPGSAGEADYEVHEWGLMRAGAGDILLAGAVAPPRQPELLVVDKPVLYFHTRQPLHLRRVSVEANGAIVEAWPPAPRTGIAAHLVWTDVAVVPGAATCALTPLPALTDTACTSLPAGEYCEVAGLATVRTPGAPCVRTRDGTDTMLFYRERTRGYTPPLRIARTPGRAGAITLRNEGANALPGFVIRIQDTHGAVRALAVRPPGPGQELVVDEDFRVADGDDTAPVDAPAPPGSPEPGRRAIRETMRELGMTDAETDAFLRSWDPMIFNVASTPVAADRRGPVDELTADGIPAPRDSILYFLPASECDQVARVTFEPAPRVFRRAFAVWSAVR